MIEEVLSRADGFSSIPMDGLRQLAERGRSKTFSKGSELMHQGDRGDAMHVILGGRVRVERSHPDLTEPLVLAELGVGEIVGEMGLFDGGPRSATVVALEETHTMELAARVLNETIVQFPAVSGALLRLLTRRLRTTDELASEIEARGAAQGLDRQPEPPGPPLGDRVAKPSGGGGRG